MFYLDIALHLFPTDGNVIITPSITFKNLNSLNKKQMDWCKFCTVLRELSRMTLVITLTSKQYCVVLCDIHLQLIIISIIN